MNHQKRGMALIFNHEYYERDYAPRRCGTNVDCQELVKCLRELEFEVKDYQNLGLKEMQDVLQNGTYHITNDNYQIYMEL